MTTEVEGVAVRTLPLMAEPTVARVHLPGRRRLHLGGRQRPGVEPGPRSTGWPGCPAPAADPRVERPGPVRLPRRAALLAAQRAPVRAVGAPDPPGHRRPGAGLAGHLDHPPVALVDHAAILPPDALPTFNSHAIESSLHKVPDLAEHFVYFNDDFFLGRPLRPGDVLQPGRPGRGVRVARPRSASTTTPDAPPYLKAAWNNRRLLQEAFGAVITHNLAHAPYPHRRSVLEEIERRFPEAVAAHRALAVPLRHRRVDCSARSPSTTG